MWIVKHRNLFYIFSIALTVISLVALFFWGLKFGIDFKGGSLLEVQYSVGTPTIADITTQIESTGVSTPSIRPTGEHGFIIRTLFLSPAEYDAVKASLTKGGEWQYEEKR